MKDRAFWPFYDQFTAAERVHLVLAAFARRDLEEVARLREGCPRVRVVAGDPQYTELLDSMWHAGMVVLCRWLDVSHHVVRARLGADASNLLAVADEARRRVASRDTKKRKVRVRPDRTVLAAQARCKEWSAVWKGLEAAITRFCAERGLTVEQLFAMVPRLPHAIEEAREDLDADSPADPEWEESVYHELCQATSGQNPGDRA
jgi:hypothetical protein